VYYKNSRKDGYSPTLTDLTKAVNGEAKVIPMWGAFTGSSLAGRVMAAA